MISVADPKFESAMWWALIPSVWTAKISDVTLLLPSAPCPRPPQLPDGTPNPKYQFCGIIDNSGTPLPNYSQISANIDRFQRFFKSFREIPRNDSVPPDRGYGPTPAPPIRQVL